MADIKIQKHLPLQSANNDLDKKIRDAAKMYERHFLNEMVKAMRGTVQHTEEPSMANRVFKDQMFDNYTEKWSDAGGIGLADIIYNQISERFNPKAQLANPNGPIPLKKGTTIKVDETKPLGIPVIQSQPATEKDLSYLMEWQGGSDAPKTVANPWDGKILQAFRSAEDRQVIKVGHDNGLVSTLSYLGRGRDFEQGESVRAGDTLGTISPDAKGLSWQIVQVERKT